MGLALCHHSNGTKKREGEKEENVSLPQLQMENLKQMIGCEQMRQTLQKVVRTLTSDLALKRNQMSQLERVRTKFFPITSLTDLEPSSNFMKSRHIFKCSIPAEVFYFYVLNSRFLFEILFDSF